MRVNAVRENVTGKNLKSGVVVAKNNQIHNISRQNMTDSITFKGKKEEKPNFKIGLSTKELKMRTNPEFFQVIEFLKPDSPKYLNLAEGDKKALIFLTEAAELIGEVYQKQDHPLNIQFRDNLKIKASKGDNDAKMALELYNGQQGIIANDRNVHNVVLLKGAKIYPGGGMYDPTITKEEFHSILKRMLNDGQDEEVKKILNQHSVVKRDGKKLKAIDFTEEYKKEFTQIADALDEAAKVSTNEDFNEFLKLQAKALREDNFELDRIANSKWARLQDTPLEFTITRENYNDNMTDSVLEDKELAKMLADRNITPLRKDKLGGRVGIVNKEGTERILNLKKVIPIISENMPYKDKYTQITTGEKASIQTMVDVDLVHSTGHVGAYRGGITIAENLPNADKGPDARRIVYHAQVRQGNPAKNLEKAKQILIDKELATFYSQDSVLHATVLHEDAHSCGPQIKNSLLGATGNIIEECKADMSSMAALDKIVENGVFSNKEKKQIITSYILSEIQTIKQKPTIHAHRIRSVMQIHNFIEKGVIIVKNKRKGLMGLLKPEGIIDINYEKFIDAAESLSKRVVDVQLKNSKEDADMLIKEHFVWNRNAKMLARTARKVNKTLNGTINADLAQMLLKAAKALKK